MRIKTIRLKNFKRFTDLIIDQIPESAKLVVVVGPNGCGKSSLFDGFLRWYNNCVGFTANFEAEYHTKDATQKTNANDTVKIDFYGNSPIKKGCFYFRSAYRNDPDFSVNTFKKPAPTSGTAQLKRLIENDTTVSKNYTRLIYQTLSGVYNVANNARTVSALREELIGQIRTSMKNVFGDLLLNSVSDPLNSGTFQFEKGTVSAYHYRNLSGGEKAAFDLLLDIHINKAEYQDAIYCVDEMETHLHTRVQGVLLHEFVKILPGQSQLWVTTHSLGVIRAAQELEVTYPGSVCIIDFSEVNSDVATELTPVSLGRVSWEKLLSIALDDFSQRIAPRTVIVCEGSAVGNRRKDFDAEIYNRILGTQSPDVLFISGGSSSELLASGITISDAIGRILPTARVVKLADLDDKSPDEVAEFEASSGIVLSLRNLESFLFADDVLEALARREGKANLIPDVLQVKNDALSASVARNNRPDDLKSAAGDIYTKLKSILSLQRPGNNTESFMRDTLAHLIVPDMATFNALKADILDKLA